MFVVETMLLRCRGDVKRVGRASVMLTTKSCLCGSFAGSSSLFSTPSGYTDWFSKSTFTLFSETNKQKKPPENIEIT